MRHVNILEKLDFNNFKVSVKSSDVLTCITAYQLLASAIEQPLHLGITESGGMVNGTVKSAIGIGLLLCKGIGDTLRVSLAADPINEVKVGFHILQALNIRKRGVNFIACPTCSRQEFDVINVIKTLESRLEDVTTPMDISIIGCMVNGIGEAEKADIGVSGHRNKRMAKINVEQNQFEEALLYLNKALVLAEDSNLKSLIALRKARLMLQQNETKNAENILNNITHPGWKELALYILNHDMHFKKLKS
uniref:Uncharacterized protein n=1 Tax=Glossina pallidipes TaxID=7398 RepID=A0A1A9Z154_GLOPL